MSLRSNSCLKRLNLLGVLRRAISIHLLELRAHRSHLLSDLLLDGLLHGIGHISVQRYLGHDDGLGYMWLINRHLSLRLKRHAVGQRGERLWRQLGP